MTRAETRMMERALRHAYYLVYGAHLTFGESQEYLQAYKTDNP